MASLFVGGGTDHPAPALRRDNRLKMYKKKFKEWGTRKNIKADEAVQVAAAAAAAATTSTTAAFWPEARRSTYHLRIARHLKRSKPAPSPDATTTSPRDRSGTPSGTPSGASVSLSAPSPEQEQSVTVWKMPAYDSTALANVEMGLHWAEQYFRASLASDTTQTRWFSVPAAQSLALDTDSFAHLFDRSVGSLAARHTGAVAVDAAFGDLNRAFAGLQTLLQADHPTVYHMLVSKIAACKRGAYADSAVCICVCRMLARHCLQLSLVVHGPRHPINKCFVADLGLLQSGEAAHFDMFLAGTRRICAQYLDPTSLPGYPAASVE